MSTSKLFVEQLIPGKPTSRPDVLYHCADILTKSLIPRVTTLKTSVLGKAHNIKALFASETPNYAFGLERVNMMVPMKFTESEVRQWKYATWLDSNPPNLWVWYWNYIPTKPLYLYTVSSEGFKPYVAEEKKDIWHWYNTEEIIPLKVQKLRPLQVKKESWKIATDQDWNIKLNSYVTKGYFK